MLVEYVCTVSALRCQSTTAEWAKNKIGLRGSLSSSGVLTVAKDCHIRDNEWKLLSFIWCYILRGSTITLLSWTTVLARV